jgi:drug/metabolite transporter (DMT)-like permease
LLHHQDETFTAASLLKISWPEIMLLLSISCAAYAWFIIKELMNKKYSLVFINGFAMLCGGMASFLTWFFARQIGLISGPAIINGQLFLVYTSLLIILSNFIVYNLYGWLLNYYSITLITMAGFLCPIFGAVYGALFLHESLHWYYLIATAGIALGLWLFHGKREVHIEP